MISEQWDRITECWSNTAVWVMTGGDAHSLEDLNENNVGVCDPPTQSYCYISITTIVLWLASTQKCTVDVLKFLHTLRICLPDLIINTNTLASQFIPLDECQAATTFGSSKPSSPYYLFDGDCDDDDSLDGAGAPSLPNSVWSLAWSITSASKQLEDVEDEAIVAQKGSLAQPSAEEVSLGPSAAIVPKESHLRRRGDGQRQRSAATSDSEGDGGSKGKMDDLEDEANSSNVSDLKRGKRFKKLTKMLCSVQVSSCLTYERDAS